MTAWMSERNVMHSGTRTGLLLLATVFLGALRSSPLCAVELQAGWAAAESARLPGSMWDATETLGDASVCRSERLEFLQGTDAQGTSVLKAFEVRKCSQRVYRLNYLAYLIRAGDRRFVSLLPENIVDPGAKPFDVLEGSSVVGASYSPDRLTLWLSNDSCTLSGAGRDANPNYRWLTLHRRDCPSQGSR